MSWIRTYSRRIHSQNRLNMNRIPYRSSRSTYSTCRPAAPRQCFGVSKAPHIILAFTRYSFTSRLLCKKQPSIHSPRLPALPTLVQYYCTIIGQYTTPLPTSRVYALHHTILVITISCQGQVGLYRILPFPILCLYIAIQGDRGDTIYYAIEWAMKAGSEVPKWRDVCAKNSIDSCTNTFE